MTEQNQNEPEEAPAEEAVAFAEFLEAHPPAQWVNLSKFDQRYRPGGVRGDFIHALATPELLLHCPSESCNGQRYFRFVGSPPRLLRQRWFEAFLGYRCSNCQRTVKKFSIALELSEELEAARGYKFGEFPPFGPRTPEKLLSFAGPDRELFLKGRRCENQGLGVGAFTYYRRVVEDQKLRILAEIRKVAEKVGASDDLLQQIEEASQETQFQNSIEKIKVALPQMLLIDGHNPLSLLHRALSKGVHEMTDEQCLTIASSIRVVLGELAERISQAMKDEEELKEAVGALLRVNADASDG